MTTNDLLDDLLDTLRRHLDVWASMDVVSTITEALYNSHLSWKARGIYMRPLVTLLLEVDDCRFLDEASRQHVLEDATHYAQVSS